MKRLNDWIASEGRRQSRQPALEHALLTDRGAGYVLFRLRWMWPRVLLRTLVHMLELYLLALAQVPDDWLAIFIGYRTSTGLASSLYWGFLEPMRESVRMHVRRRHHGSARLVIHNWLRVALLLGVVGTSVAATWILLRPSEYEGLSIFNVFGIACFVRLAFDLWARTLHSGIFATRRIYRPVWSLVLPELVEVGLLLALFPAFELSAFLAMVVGGGIVRISLSNHYAKLAYRGSRIDVPSVVESVRCRSAITRSEMLSAGKLLLSNATSQLDGVIILLLVFGGGDDGEAGMGFAGIYYVVRPLMAMAQGWVRAFYFDFKRVEHSGGLFRRRFHSLLVRTALVLAMGVAMIAVGVSALLYQQAPEPYLLCLVPFFVARSLFSVRQLEAFSYGGHDQLLRVSVGILLVVCFVAWMSPSDVVLTLFASAALALGYWLLRGSARRSLVPGRAVSLARWLSCLRNEVRPVRIHAFIADRTLTTGVRLMRRIADAPTGVCVTRFGHSHVLSLEVLDGPGTPMDRAHWITRTAGTVIQLRAVQGRDGASALCRAKEQGVLPRELCALLNAEPTEDLVGEYRRECPNGTVIDASQGGITDGRRLAPREVREVMRAITTQARGQSVTARGRLDVLVYAPGGEPETIFITPIDQRPSADFRRRVQAATLRASMRDTPAAGVAQRRP